MQRKDLALRVLSTAAIMSIVTSIAAPAFAGTYYMDNGNLSIRQDEYGKVWVKSGDSDELEDKDKEVIICGGAGDNKWANAPAGGAADEQQPHPNAGSTLNETQEGSAQTQEGSAQTKEGSAQTKEGSAQTEEDSAQTEEDSPKDPSTEPAPTTSADPEEKTLKTTQADTTTTSAQDSAPKPTQNVINVVNNWVGAAAKELKIRLSNVNIKQTYDSKYADGNKEEHKGCVSGMTVKGSGNTKMELDGQNVLDSYGTDYPASYQAGLRKQGEGTLTITDETDDRGNKITAPKSGDSGSLTAKGGGSNDAADIGKAIGAAGIGG